MKRSTEKYLLLIGLSLAVILFISPITVSPVTAKAPPEPVCGVCTGQLNEAANDHGVVVERGESTMNIQLTPNGTAEFVALVELRQGADRLRNDSLREKIVRDVSYILVNDRRNLQTAIVDGNLRVQYSSRDVAHKTLGVVQFDAFHIEGAPPFASGGEGSPYPGADRLTLRGPSGYQLQGTNGEFTNKTSVGWKGDSHEQYSGHIEEDITISFVSNQALLPNIRVIVANFLD
jgi:hypothetical protein